MITRRIGSGLGAALPTVLLGLSLNAPALAQDPADPAAGEAAPADDTPSTAAFDEAPAPPPAEEPPPSDPPPEPEPAEPEPAPPAVREPAEAAIAPEPATPAAEGATSSERERAAALLGVELLPGSAFPEVYTRGLKYGSLWLTFHGQQWPYMPAIDGKPGIRIGLSGYLWNDLSNVRITVDESLAGAGLNDQNRWTTQSRGILRVTPTYNVGDGWFAQGNAEIVVQGDNRPDPQTQGTTTTEDLYVRVGKWNLFDVTVGRFQGWEIANHFGMALDYATLERQGATIPNAPKRPTDGYGLTYYWDRQNYLVGGYALHVYPTPYLRGELLGHLGAGQGSSNPYTTAIRPSGIFDIGWLKVKAGYEYGKLIPQDEKQQVRDSKNGWGVAAQFVFLPYVEFGGSFARGYQDILDQNGNADLTNSNTVQTFGGFVNFSPGHEPLLFGGGFYYNSYENFRLDTNPGEHFNEVDTNDQILAFGAVQYTLWERLYFKFVVSHASNKVEDFNAGSYINNALGGRFRMMLLY